jgi:hypothetical protein
MELIKIFFVFFCFFYWSSCANKQNVDSKPDIQSKYLDEDDVQSVTDTVLTPFKDSTFKLRIKSMSLASDREEVYNTSIVLTVDNYTVYSDSVYSMSFNMQMKDFDNDGQRDLMIFHSSGGRANPTFYLYLMKPDGRRLMKVAGFEDLPNPDLDGDIITSTALAGKSYVYKFFRISSYRLSMLDSFVTSAGDTLMYQRRMMLLKLKQPK